jgi:thiamine transport system substrate-binding protein
MATVRASLPEAAARPRGTGEVVVLSHDSFSVTKETFIAFTNQTGYAVRVVKMGDAGEALNKALLSKDAPLGDVLFGVDNALIHRAKAENLFQPYASPNLTGVDDRFAAPFCADGRMLATPIDYGYVMPNVDGAWMRQNNVTPPTDLRDLANATYAKLTVVENPRTSSPGFAFLLATVDRFGTEGNYTYQDFWRDFQANGGKVVSGWEQAYGEEFTQGWSEDAARDRPIVVSYSTSPAFNPMNAYTENATSETLDLPMSAWFQVEAAGILQGAKNPEGARAFLDYMLGAGFQEDAAFSMVVYPVHRDAKAPEAYALYAPEPRQPATLAPETIDANRDAWLKGWTQATGQV